MSAGQDAKLIRAALSPAHVLDHFEIEYREYRGELCTRQCPRCGERSRASVYVDASSGAWHCHAHGCRGDLFALIAGHAGMDVRRAFPAVVALAASIAGVDGDLSPSERERLVVARHRRDAERAEQERTRAEAARARMPALWAALERRDARGELYLRGRGLDPAPFHARDIVRYTQRGEPAVLLRDLANGEAVGIQRRRIDHVAEGEPRVLSISGSQVTGSCLLGRLADLAPGGADLAVIAEGLVDTLTARLAWPAAAIFGAPGAGQLERVASAIAQRVAAIRGALLIVADADRAGREAAERAIVRAERAGLLPVPADAQLAALTVRLVDLGVGLDGRPHHDLADAWRRSGWRWRWPGGGR